MASGAIRVHHTRTSDVDWDGPGTEANLPNDAPPAKMRALYAWVDPRGKPETKDAYKFPHHEVTGRGAVGAANEKACISGIGILNGGRGGADIPSGDRRMVYNHLAAHLRDARREPPGLRR